MHTSEIQQRQRSQSAVRQEQRARHPCDQQGQGDADRNRGGEEETAMLMMKVVPETECRAPRELRVEQAVRYVEEPCSQRQRSRQPQCETQVCGQAEGPAPES